ncbi:YbaM family protein [Marinomonas sp. 15G1-11]|uniref:YbaM family protein n=1 Tax=Marinomonas phaeophyticola TaxID=3004091 RepID=A0ABT4JXX3_9GAMM|nr:YbaM family protein [Marinomonas sp. 15G1-11]MCZ2723133.1 YbaM family protein [Marinomonas sp. 15G1-11]
MSLKKAPKHIQLAVDLIDLLETNQIEAHIAVQALEIVLNDFKKKQVTEQEAGNANKQT